MTLLKIKNLIIICVLTSCTLLSSCSEESTTEFRPIVLESSTIPFESSDDGFMLKSRITSEPTSILLVPAASSAKMAHVTSVKINDQPQSLQGELTGDGPFLEEYPELRGDWGSITYHNDGPTIELRLTANDAVIERKIEIQLGYGYEYVIINIIQSCVPGWLAQKL